MFNEDGSVVIVFNGEIYNFPSLRVDLIARGHVFRSTSDTEVIVHLYEEYGEGCVAKLRGMFAFAIWDTRKRLLLLARDRVGIKPLYFLQNGRALMFASEVKALMTVPGVDRSVNQSAIDRFLTYYYLPGSETLFRGVVKLEPGHYLTVLDGVVRKRQYWDLKFPDSSQWSDLPEAVERLQELLSRTVKDHMIADVPVGVLLSGGVDSTGMLRYAAQHSSRPISSFTVGFAGANFADERPYARLAAEQFGATHQEISISPEAFREFLPRYVWHMEEPVCEPPAVSLYFLSKLARDSAVKVLLSGEGGDEAFAGYPKYGNLMRLQHLKSALGPLGRAIAPAMRALGLIMRRDLRHYTAFLQMPVESFYYGVSSTPQTPFNEQKRTLYNETFARAVSGSQSDAPTRDFFAAIPDKRLLRRMLYVDTKSWLPDDLLIKADRMTMAASVELRVPFLDHEVLEFAASLPDSFKVKGRSMKHILRLALQDAVPQEILTRKKAGFPLPYDQWFRGPLKNYVNDVLLSNNAAILTYFRKESVRKLLEHQQGETGGQRSNGRRQHALDGSSEVFSLLVLELWHKQLLGQQPAAS